MFLILLYIVQLSTPQNIQPLKDQKLTTLLTKSVKFCTNPQNHTRKHLRGSLDISKVPSPPSCTIYSLHLLTLLTKFNVTETLTGLPILMIIGQPLVCAFFLGLIQSPSPSSTKNKLLWPPTAVEYCSLASATSEILWIQTLLPKLQVSTTLSPTLFLKLKAKLSFWN